MHHLRVVVDGGELIRKLLTNRSQKFYKPINVHSVTYAIGESVPSASSEIFLISQVSIIFLVARFFL